MSEFPRCADCRVVTNNLKPSEMEETKTAKLCKRCRRCCDECRLVGSIADDFKAGVTTSTCKYCNQEA